MNFHSQCISKRTKKQAVLSDRIHLFVYLMTTWDVGSYSVCSMKGMASQRLYLWTQADYSICSMRSKVIEENKLNDPQLLGNAFAVLNF